MIKALLFPCLMFLAAVAAMLAGNASAVEEAIITYDKVSALESIPSWSEVKGKMDHLSKTQGVVVVIEDEFTDEKRILFMARDWDVSYAMNDDLDSQGTMVFWCTSDSIYMVLRQFGKESVDYPDEYIDVKIRVDKAPYETARGIYVEDIGIAFKDLKTKTVSQFLVELILSGLGLIVMIDNNSSAIMRFLVPMIRDSLIRFEEGCRELQEPTGEAK